MNRLLFLVLGVSLFLCRFQSFGQDSRVDSLRAFLRTGTDYQMLLSSLELAEFFVTGSEYSDSVKYYGLLASELALNQKNERSYLDAQILIGRYYNDRNLPDSALIVYNGIHKRVVGIEDSSILGKFYYRFAAPYERMEKMEEATRYTLTAIAIYEAQGNFEELIQAYYNLSIVFSRSEDYEKSLSYRRKAWRLSDESPLELRSTLASSLAGVFGELYILQKDTSLLDSVVYYAQIGLEIAKHMGSKSLELKNEIKLIGVYLMKSEFDQGLNSCQSMIRDAKFIKEDKWLCQGYYRMVDFLINLDRFHEATLYADSALLVANRMRWTFYQKESLGKVYESNKMAGNYLKSLNAFEQYKEFSDSLNNSQKLYDVNVLEIEYQTEKKEQQIANLEKENEIQTLKLAQQRTIILSSVLILVLIVFSVYFYYQKRLITAKEQTALHKQQLLRSQVNPHFIFNALTSIRGFLFDQADLKKAVNYLGQFAKLMRMVLDHSSKEWVTLQEEMEALKIYMDIQKMRFDNGFNYTINIDPSIAQDRVRVPPLLAQPFIENAIEHGFKNIPYEGHLSLNCYAEGEFIRFSIIDNGIGVDHVKEETNQDASHESKALSIFKQRLEILSKQLKMNLSFKISDLGTSSETSGTEVAYTLPIKLTYA